jgi:DNA-binding HxlR family transcriptional regulator
MRKNLGPHGLVLILRDLEQSTTQCVVGALLVGGNRNAMTRYGQFCPIAKSAEIIGDPWSILIVRELLLGSSRFNVLQRGLPRISPTILNKRLRELEVRGVITRRRLSGQRGHEYRLTAAGRELSKVIEALAIWGMRWAREAMAPDDLDVAFLMFDIERRIDTAALPDGETVLCFQFTDLTVFGTWWLVCRGSEVDLCYDDPGKDVDCYITGSSRDLIGVWMGDIPLSNALNSDAIRLTGESHLCRTFPMWFARSVFADTPRPTEAEKLSGDQDR